MTKLEWLESVAEWAGKSMARRDAYASLVEAGRGGREDYDWHDVKEAAWGEVKSADAMLKASLKELERAKADEILKRVIDHSAER